MSLFDKDIIERPVSIPKEDSIEYTVKWMAEILCKHISSHNSSDKLSPYSNSEYCRDYIKFTYTNFFYDLMNKKLPVPHPEECEEYPCILEYYIDIEYKVPYSDRLGGNIYDIYLNYRTNLSPYYILQNLQICI